MTVAVPGAKSPSIQQTPRKVRKLIWDGRRPFGGTSTDASPLIVPYVVAGWVNPISQSPTIRELSGRLHFLSVGRYAVKVRPLLVGNIRFRLVNKPGCQHEKIGASVPLTTIIGV